jgi:hypothetical protein
MAADGLEAIGGKPAAGGATVLNEGGFAAGGDGAGLGTAGPGGGVGRAEGFKAADDALDMDIAPGFMAPGDPARGRDIMKVFPLPTWDSIQSFPPKVSTIDLMIGKRNPVPINSGPAWESTP